MRNNSAYRKVGRATRVPVGLCGPIRFVCRELSGLTGTALLFLEHNAQMRTTRIVMVKDPLCGAAGRRKRERNTHVSERL